MQRRRLWSRPQAHRTAVGEGQHERAVADRVARHAHERCSEFRILRSRGTAHLRQRRRPSSSHCRSPRTRRSRDCSRRVGARARRPRISACQRSGAAATVLGRSASCVRSHCHVGPTRSFAAAVRVGGMALLGMYAGAPDVRDKFGSLERTRAGCDRGRKDDQGPRRHRKSSSPNAPDSSIAVPARERRARRAVESLPCPR